MCESERERHSNSLKAALCCARCAMHMMPFGRVSLFYICTRARISALPLLELRAESCEGRDAIPKVVYIMWVLFPVSFVLWRVYGTETLQFP